MQTLRILLRWVCLGELFTRSIPSWTLRILAVNSHRAISCKMWTPQTLLHVIRAEIDHTSNSKNCFNECHCWKTCCEKCALRKLLWWVFAEILAQLIPITVSKKAQRTVKMLPCGNSCSDSVTECSHAPFQDKLKTQCNSRKRKNNQMRVMTNALTMMNTAWILDNKCSTNTHAMRRRLISVRSALVAVNSCFCGQALNHRVESTTSTSCMNLPKATTHAQFFLSRYVMRWDQKQTVDHNHVTTCF